MTFARHSAFAFAVMLLAASYARSAVAQEHGSPLPASESSPNISAADPLAAVGTETLNYLGRAPGAPRGLAFVCMEQNTKCHVPDGVVRTVLRLKSSDIPIVAGQLALRYDPETLEVVDISAGRGCEATSPFVLSFAEKIDKELGMIFLAVSVDPKTITDGSTGPTALACFTFRALEARTTSVGLVPGLSPVNTILSDPDGDAVNIQQDEDCPPDQTGMFLTATTVKIGRQCACYAGTVDCSLMNSQCTEGVCNPAAGACQPEVVNDNRPCDDGAECTVLDACLSGQCVGMRLNCPSMCLTAEQSCPSAGDQTQIRVQLGRSLTHVAAAQFSVQYDPAETELLSIGPGVRCDPDSPFTFRVHEQKSSSTGEVHFGVSVDPFNLFKATRGPATIACLTFRALANTPGDICLYDEGGAHSLRLADRLGHAVPISNAGACEATQPYPVMACNVGCRNVPAASTWGLAALTLGVLTVGKLMFGAGPRGGRRRPN